MGIDAYISNQTIQKWFNAVIKELDFLDDCTLHKNLDALYNSLLHVKNSRVVLIDIEDKASIDYFLSIKNGFDNISCVAIGLNKNITESFVYFNLGFYAYIDLSYTAVEFYQALSKSTNHTNYLSANQQDMLLKHLVSHSDILNIGINSIATISGNGHANGHGNGHAYGFDTIKYSEKALTEKEKKVCEFLLKGYTYKEIANTIGVTSFAVNQRVKGIYKKLQVRSRAELSFRYLS
jgi:DNA-binding NarL/FixJ family response regulator